MKNNPFAMLLITAVVGLFIMVVVVQLGMAVNAEYCLVTPTKGSGLGGGYDCSP